MKILNIEVIENEGGIENGDMFTLKIEKEIEDDFGNKTSTFSKEIVFKNYLEEELNSIDRDIAFYQKKKDIVINKLNIINNQ